MPFFTPWRDLSHSSFIYLSYTSRSFLHFIRCGAFVFQIPPGPLFETGIVEPHIVIATVLCQLLLVLDSPLPENCGLD
jgi:hypothetical protein